MPAGDRTCGLGLMSPSLTTELAGKWLLEEPSCCGAELNRFWVVWTPTYRSSNPAEIFPKKSEKISARQMNGDGDFDPNQIIEDYG